MRHQDDGQVRRSLGANTSYQEQSPDFDLVGTTRTVVVCETRGFTCTTCWSGSSPTGCIPIQITMILSDMSDRLLLLSSRSMSCCIDGIGLEDVVYGYIIMMITCWHFLFTE
jgi:hypothetical protein